MRKIAVAVLVTTVLLCQPEWLWAAAAEGSGWHFWEPIGRWFNLLLLAGVIYYFTRQPLSRFFSERREGIRREIEAAGRARREAEEKLAAMKKRMDSLDQELERIRREAEKEAEREWERVVSEAEAEARRIVAAARREIEGLTRQARKELREYAAELAVRVAEERIRREMTPEDDKRIFSRFVVELRGGEGGR